mmetsp:Transcript_3901/g.8931  ORF Transcript_3901/g.8931 Transcript_3901/m.8931 type:complete len:251 (+) Transcript_3901:1914-2666(+)
MLHEGDQIFVLLNLQVLLRQLALQLLLRLLALGAELRFGLLLRLRDALQQPRALVGQGAIEVLFMLDLSLVQIRQLLGRGGVSSRHGQHDPFALRSFCVRGSLYAIATPRELLYLSLISLTCFLHLGPTFLLELGSFVGELRLERVVLEAECLALFYSFLQLRLLHQHYFPCEERSVVACRHRSRRGARRRVLAGEALNSEEKDGSVLPRCHQSSPLRGYAYRSAGTGVQSQFPKLRKHRDRGKEGQRAC